MNDSLPSQRWPRLQNALLGGACVLISASFILEHGFLLDPHNLQLVTWMEIASIFLYLSLLVIDSLPPGNWRAARRSHGVGFYLAALFLLEMIYAAGFGFSFEWKNLNSVLWLKLSLLIFQGYLFTMLVLPGVSKRAPFVPVLLFTSGDGRRFVSCADPCGSGGSSTAPRGAGFSSFLDRRFVYIHLRRLRHWFNCPGHRCVFFPFRSVDHFDADSAGRVRHNDLRGSLSIHIRNRWNLRAPYYSCRISLQAEGLNRVSTLLWAIVTTTLVCEAVGALVLFFCFLPSQPSINDAAFTALFHSVSAFCNAGFFNILQLDRVLRILISHQHHNWLYFDRRRRNWIQRSV